MKLNGRRYFFIKIILSHFMFSSRFMLFPIFFRKHIFPGGGLLNLFAGDLR